MKLEIIKKFNTTYSTIRFHAYCNDIFLESFETIEQALNHVEAIKKAVTCKEESVFCEEVVVVYA